MSSPQITYSGPRLSEGLDPEVRRHLQIIYQKLGNHTQAMQILSEKSSTSSTATVQNISVVSSGITGVASGGTGVSAFPADALLLGDGAAPLVGIPPVQPPVAPIQRQIPVGPAMGVMSSGAPGTKSTFEKTGFSRERALPPVPCSSSTALSTWPAALRCGVPSVR